MLSSGYERMNEKHLSMFSLRLESRETCLFRGSLCFQYNLLSRARDFTTFTLHDLTVFCIIIHVFIAADQITKSSLRARGPPGVSGALRSLCILRIGNIGSGCDNKSTGVVRNGFTLMQ